MTNGGQSPIAIGDWIECSDRAPTFAYDSPLERIERVLGVPMLHFRRGSQLRLDARRYRLLQCHWHTPAEHWIDGEELAAELHLVHQGEAGDLLVVAAAFRIGDSDPTLQRLIDVTSAADRGRPAAGALNAAECTPHGDGFYRYSGSLTAPPYSEPVQWYVSRTIGAVSRQQVEQLQALTGGANARPLQDRSARTICLVCP